MRSLQERQRVRLVTALIAVFLVFAYIVGAVASSSEARVTRIIREVNLLPSDAAPHLATLNDLVRDNTGLRTGNESRTELTLPDLTITRLGANTIFSFQSGGRSAQLDAGSMLLCVPKDSGGATIRTIAVTVAVTGTTLILEINAAGRHTLTVLEGAATISLVKHPEQSERIVAGQTLEVQAGARTLPDPMPLDLCQILRSDPLIIGFAALPTQNLIIEAMQNSGEPESPSEGPTAESSLKLQNPSSGGATIPTNLPADLARPLKPKPKPTPTPLSPNH